MNNTDSIYADLLEVEKRARHARITLLDDKARPLSREQWDLLARCERVLYHGNDGTNGWTDVMENDGDAMLNQLWEQASIAVDAINGTTGEVAQRVAAALAIISFGKEFLLK